MAPDDASTGESAPRRVLGVEGAAWTASASIYDVAADEVTIETDAYAPD
jgi:N6-L-threonylcarbamoyladenine synthase/protein kinase Bud32